LNILMTNTGLKKLCNDKIRLKMCKINELTDREIYENYKNKIK
jgi:hypothetical protein